MSASGSERTSGTRSSSVSPTEISFTAAAANSLDWNTIYNFGFASVHVWLKTYQYYGLTYLRVWTYTDFTPADGRTDYSTDEWMLQ